MSNLDAKQCLEPCFMNRLVNILRQNIPVQNYLNPFLLNYKRVFEIRYIGILILLTKLSCIYISWQDGTKENKADVFLD